VEIAGTIIVGEAIYLNAFDKSASLSKRAMAIGAAYTAVCNVLFIAALLERDCLYLPFAVAGFFVFLILHSYSLRLKKEAKALGYGSPVGRDERAVAAIDWLSESTQAGAFGSEPVRDGLLAWLTTEGVFSSDGKYRAWETFATFSLAKPFDGKRRIVLSIAVPGIVRRALIGVCALFALAASINAAGGLIGCHYVGFRLDVITDFAWAIMPIVLFYVTVIAYVRIAPYGRMNLLAVDVPDSQDTIKAVTGLLMSHLSEDARNFVGD
jgi:hypothetical protein